MRSQTAENDPHVVLDEEHAAAELGPDCGDVLRQQQALHVVKAGGGLVQKEEAW